MTYFPFDVLHLDGSDLRPSDFRTRREVLEKVPARHGQDRVRLSATFNADSASVLQSACKMGLEGISPSDWTRLTGAHVTSPG